MDAAATAIANAAIAINPADAAVVAVNGYRHATGVESQVARVADDWKVVVGDGDRFLLLETVARDIYFAQGAPAVSTAFTAAVGQQIMTKVGLRIAQNEIIRVYRSSAEPWAVRASDVVPLAAWEALCVPAVVGVPPNPDVPAGRARGARLGAELVIAAMRQETAHAAVIMAGARNVLLMLIANALHRIQSNGHNWITDARGMENSVASRAIGVAGAEKNAFVPFAAMYGHDLWHFLSDRTLYAMATAFTGENAHAAISTEPIQYNGVDYAVGVALHTVINAGQAAEQRWPPGKIGTAAIVNGLTALAGMINALAMKAEFQNAGWFESVIVRLKSDVVQREGNVVDFVRAKAVLGEVMAKAVGFMDADATGADRQAKLPSLNGFKKSYEAAYISGLGLGKVCKEVDVNTAAFAESISAFLQVTSNALAALTGELALPADAFEVRVIPTKAELKVLAERRELGGGY